MAVAVVIDVADGNQQFYDQIVPTLFPDGELPEGWVDARRGPSETGWRIVNVVPSQEGFEAFARESLGPVLQELEGVTPEMRSSRSTGRSRVSEAPMSESTPPRRFRRAVQANRRAGRRDGRRRGDVARDLRVADQRRA